MSDREWVEETKEIVSRLNCHLNEDVFERLLSLYLIEEDPEEKLRIKSEVESVLGLHTPLLLFSRKPMLPSPKKEEIDGEIRIGKVVQGGRELHDFGLSRKELNQHMLITARSGAGKTTLIMQIIKELISKDIPFLVFDFKQDYRHLIKYYPRLIVIRWKDLRINPLEPPANVSFQEWKQQFLSIFGHVEGVWHGSTQYLLEAIDRAYGEKKGIPTIGEVYDIIHESNESTRKLQEYASVVETRLYGLLSKLGRTINNERTLTDMEKLLKLPVVLELDGLGRDEANILTLYFFYWIYAYRKANGQRGKLLHVLIIDEAKRIFTGSEAYSQTTAEYSGIPPADLVCDEIRDFGEGIIASDQESTKLSNSLKANTYTKITGLLGNGKDINDMAEAMDLSDEEREAITKLERGEWLVKLAGRYVKPFMIKSEDFPLEKNVSDEKLNELMKPVIEKLVRDEERVGEVTKEFELSADSLKLLENVSSHPFNGMVGRQRELGISATRIERAKQELISKGLVEKVDVSLRGGRPTSFLVLTKKALQLLEAKGFDTTLWRHVGNVGFEHALYQALIRWEFKKLGYDAHLEVRLENGRRIDVLATRDDRRVGVEVELNANFDISQKLNGIESLDELYIITKKELFDELKNKLGNLPNKVKLYSIDRFLERLRNLYLEKSGINSFKQNKAESTPSHRNNVENGSLEKSKSGGKKFG